MVTIKHTRESIADLEKQLEQYKTAHHKLTAGLKEAVAESIQYKRERDSLIKDVEKLREENKALRLQADEYFELWQNEKLTSQGLREQCKEYAQDASKYMTLTQHIRNKAEHNPSVSRYKDLVHYIDDLNRGE